MKLAEQYEEQVLLSGLLRDPEPFGQFYVAERPKIALPLAWIRDPSLPEGVRAAATTDYAGNFHVIHLRSASLRPDDALMVAEELEHCVNSEEGFPGVSPIDPQFGNLAGVISSMLADPIAHSRLQQFGFNYTQGFEAEQRESRRQLAGRPEPNNGVDVFLWMCNFASSALEARILGMEENAFLTWFDEAYPKVAGRGRELLRRVDRHGYATPEQQTSLLRDIIRRYRLDGYVRLRVR